MKAIPIEGRAARCAIAAAGCGVVEGYLDEGWTGINAAIFAARDCFSLEADDVGRAAIISRRERAAAVGFRGTARNRRRGGHGLFG
jgi:hypothetical protein